MSQMLPDIAAEAAVIAMIRRALEEDIASGDATTLSLVPEDLTVEAHILAKEDCVVSGGPVAAAVFAGLDDSINIETVVGDSYFFGKCTMHRVVLKQVPKIVLWNKVINSNNFKIARECCCTIDKPSNSSKTINANSNSHCLILICSWGPRRVTKTGHFVYRTRHCKKQVTDSVKQNKRFNGATTVSMECCHTPLCSSADRSCVM